MQQPLRYAERLEALHIAHIASYEWQELWQGTGKRALKGGLSNAIYFFQLSCAPMSRATTVDRYVLYLPPLIVI